MFTEYKRKVTIRAMTWVKEDYNATHYYISFNVESNPLLVAEDNGFREVVLWDHPKEHKSYRLNWDEAIPYEEIAETADFDAIKRNFVTGECLR